MKQVVRISGYKDYIALDFTNGKGNILSTPFYISNGQQIEVHWGTPSDERCENPRDYDDFHDKYVFKMEAGLLYILWLNGPCNSHAQFTKINPKELVDWKFEHATKIKSAEKITTPVSR